MQNPTVAEQTMVVTTDVLKRVTQILTIMEKQHITLSDLENQLNGTGEIQHGPIIQEAVAPQVQYIQIGKPKLSPLAIGEAWAEYIAAEVVAKGMATSTIENWNWNRRVVMEYCNGGSNKHGLQGKEIVDIQDVTLEDMIDFRKYLNGWLAQDVVRIITTRFCKVARWCGMRGYNVLNTEFVGMPKHQKRRVQFLTYDEVRDFIEVVKQPHRNLTEAGRLRNVAICEVLFSSGARISEVMNLNKDSIKNKTFLISETKSKNSREAYISDRAERAINAYLEERGHDKCPALFISTQDTVRYKAGSVRRFFRNACNDSRFTKVHPHTFRHSFGTYMLLNKVDLITIAHMMGHESVQTTQIYTHVTNPQVREAYERVMAHV